MRRAVVVLAVCGLAASIVAAVALSAVQSPPAPSLSITVARPLTVAGRHFRPHEHVRITATLAGQRTTRSVNVGRTGRFQVVFAQLGMSRCDQLRVVVTRRAGALVVLKRLPAPACSLS